jgi:predicted amidohydrolase
VSPQVYNSTFVFDPQGNVLVSNPDGSVLHSPAETAGVLRGSFNKAYLTQDEEDTLPLAFGRVQDLDVLDTPVGRLAAVISKDAWMIDVNDRYAAKGANLILQPEAYSDWSYYATPWEPDGFKAGGFAQVQRNPGFLYNVTAALTGNLAEVTFDGQSAVIGKRVTPAPALSAQTAWIGQNPDSGFLRIAPWIMDDPGIADAQLTLSERRMLLAQAGAHLLPGAQPLCSTPTSTGACQDGYRESVIHADVQLPDGADVVVPPDTTPRVPTAFGTNLEVSGGEGVTHQYAGVAAHGGNVYVTWQDDRSGYDNVFLAVSHDRGGHFVEQRVSDNPAGAVMELRPALGLSPDGHDLFIAWQEFCVGRDDDCGRIKLAHFDAGGAKIGGDTRVDHGGDGAGKWNPAVAVRRDRSPLVAWVDERDPGPGGLRFEHIYFARGLDRGARLTLNVRADAGAPVTPAAALDNKWAPAVAASGRRIYVAWTDFRNYNWDIYLTHSFFGTHFSSNVRVDDFPDLERLDDHPSIAVDDRGIVHAVWADRRDTQSDANVFYARSLDGGRTFSANRQIDSSLIGFDPDRDTPSNQWAPQVAVSGSDVLAVWQDNRLGNTDIFYVRSRDRGLTFDTDERVDDAGSGPSNRFRPTLAVDNADPAGRIVYVVWEDYRNGTADIFLARRPLS